MYFAAIVAVLACMVYFMFFDENSFSDDEEKSYTKKKKRKKPYQRPSRAFHEINLNYPGLKKLHEKPNIYTIDDFFTEEECTSILSLAKDYPDAMIDSKTVGAEADYRTSKYRVALSYQIPDTIMPKITGMFRKSTSYIEHLQLIEYQRNQYYKSHTDSPTKPHSKMSTAGFMESHRLVTLFVYLNDVEKGGHTNFTNINVAVKPKRGRAVIHFPATIGGHEDKGTRHCSEPVLEGEKYILVTWLWNDRRTHAVDLDRYLDAPPPQ
eukprot:g4117.t1